MANAKICKQCGELKPIEQFRKYYGGRKGHYNTCKLCEKINSRYKYLRNKGESMDFSEESEFGKIERLYAAQRAAGLQPPNENVGTKVSIADSLDDMIAKYKLVEPHIIPVAPGTQPVVVTIPAELQMWLKCELTEEPDYYLDEVYEELKAKYRPQLRIDTATMQPVYDDTHKAVLEQILERFYKYEEDYWDKE